jgi:hypothetical protein
MYYIYHIEGVKIGCSKNPKRRVKAQGYTEFTILETHTDIQIASERERSLQKEYGLKVDNKQYKDVITMCSLGGLVGGKKGGLVGGKKAGNINKLSGHISNLGKKFGPIQGKKNVENKFWEKTTTEQRASGGKKSHELNKEMYKEMGHKINNNLSICPYCKKEGQNRVMHRWHFENCKLK